MKLVISCSPMQTRLSLREGLKKRKLDEIFFWRCLFFQSTPLVNNSLGGVFAMLNYFLNFFLTSLIHLEKLIRKVTVDAMIAMNQISWFCPPGDNKTSSSRNNSCLQTFQSCEREQCEY